MSPKRATVKNNSPFAGANIDDWFDGPKQDEAQPETKGKKRGRPVSKARKMTSVMLDVEQLAWLSQIRSQVVGNGGQIRQADIIRAALELVRALDVDWSNVSGEDQLTETLLQMADKSS